MDSRLLGIVVRLGFAAIAVSAPRVMMAADEWEYSFAPSFWATGLQGNITADGVSADLDAGFNDTLDVLDFGATLAFEARKRRWGVFGEAAYLKLSPSARVPDSFGGSAGVKFDKAIASAAVLRNVVDNPKARLDLLAGLRYTAAEAEFKSGSGSEKITGTGDWVDPMIGTKGRIGINENWFVPFYLDIGGFGTDSDFSWQGFAGAGYRFEWGDAVLGYRHLDVDYDTDDFAYDAYTGGISLGAVFTF